jgi:excisionase family DNA binding protein
MARASEVRAVADTVTMTTKEAAKQLGISPTTLRLQAAHERIQAERVNGRWVFSQDAIDDYQRTSRGRQGVASPHHQRQAAAMYEVERAAALTLRRWGVDDLPAWLVAALPSEAEIRAARPAEVRGFYYLLVCVCNDVGTRARWWLYALQQRRQGLPIAPMLTVDTTLLLEEAIGLLAPDAPDPPPILAFARVHLERRRRQPRKMMNARRTPSATASAYIASASLAVAAGADAADA